MVKGRSRRRWKSANSADALAIVVILLQRLLLVCSNGLLWIIDRRNEKWNGLSLEFEQIRSPPKAAKGKRPQRDSKTPEYIDKGAHPQIL
ncbi:hypothetical protein HHK36_004039 [Tetracentron sinense]|uniref:Uncharacterized protein n=1 Tax=Tetracentron sinense TaxID=13715 RepID=A0A834ZZM6_TETSI|nr:hypothetical protein HHK36_004039 [Tetracentron sinense]